MIKLHPPKLSRTTLKSVNKVLKTNWLSTSGKNINKLETKLGKINNTKYCCATINGTSALDLAIKSIKPNVDCEIITTSLSWISTVNAILYNDIKPIFLNIDNNFNLNLDDLEKFILNETYIRKNILYNKKTNKRIIAILYTNLYGNTLNIYKIKRILKKKGTKIFLIEDAAEVMGLKYKNKYCGSFGDISILSFYANKHITTGEGGMVLTNNRKFKDKIFDYKNLCFGKKNRFNHYDIGWNYRYTNLQASLGISQIRRINKIILKKKEIGKKYYDNLKNCKNIYIQKPKLNNIENVYWVVGIVILNEKMTATKFRNELKEYKIETREFFWPMNKQDALKKYNLRFKKNYKNSEYISKYGLYLPSGLGTSDKDINYVCKCVKKIKKRFNF